MRLDPLPKLADPQQLADPGTELDGELDLGSLQRLQDLAPGSSGKARAKLSFYRDEMKRVIMAGQAQAHLTLACQRCGAAFLSPIKTDWQIIFARSEEDERSLADQGRDVWYHSGFLDVAEIVEEELILALPIAPRHSEECIAEQQQALAPHPFAALAGLLERGLPNK